jgi:hypothetical protein
MNIALLILCSIGLAAVVFKICGWKGLNSVLLFAGVLLLKDGAGHLWGRIAEWTVVGLFAAACIAMYIIQRRTRGQQSRNKHDTEIQ